MEAGPPREVYVYGTRSYAATLSALARECGWQVLGRIDDFAPAEQTAGSFESLTARHAGTAVGLLIGVGYNNLTARWQLWQRVRAAGWQTPTLIHPRAHVAPSATIGEGCVLMAGAVLDHLAALGEACVLWPQACVNHDSKVGENCFLSPQALLCGDVQLGAHSFIGARAVVVDGAQLPERSFLKMGQCITRKTP